MQVTKDTVAIHVEQFRGSIQWQESMDSINWVNLEGETNDSLKVTSNISKMYRAMITEGNCSPIFSSAAKIITDTITVKIEDVITVNFPKGSISILNPTVEKIPELENQYPFDVTKELYQVSTIIPYQIKISVGDKHILNDEIEVIITAPNDFIAQMPSNNGIQLFALTYQNGGQEILDHFEPIYSSFDSENNTLRSKLPQWIFTNARNDTYETILTLATIPLNSNLKSATIECNVLVECCGAPIRCPLDNCEGNVTSLFQWDRLDPLGSGDTKNHLGNDFGVPVGSNVYAVSDGVIEIFKINTVADPESSTGYNGYGLYITIRHPDNSASLYGHLSKETYEIAFIGKQVKRGDIIAKSGGAINDYPYAGGSTGPHLHLSYVKSGSLVDSNNNANKLNPIKCILGPSGPAGAPTFPAGAPTFPANP